MFRRLFWPLVGCVVLVGLLFLFVFPTRTWLQQRDQIEAVEARLEVLDEQNARLANRVEQLQTDAEIERLARERYQLVKPGEEAYAILPAPGAPVPERIAGIEARPADTEGDDPWWRRAWESVTGLF